MEQSSICKITTGGRITHFVLGMGLVTSVFAGSGPLGLAAVLPLVGVYPVLTAILGVDAVHALVGGGRGREGRGPAVNIRQQPICT